MGLKKLGFPYSNNGNHQCHTPTHKKNGQSYMWRVVRAKTEKKLFKTEVYTYGSEVFRNKVEAMEYQNHCVNSGYDATFIQKWDPTK